MTRKSTGRRECIFPAARLVHCQFYEQPKLSPQLRHL